MSKDSVKVVVTGPAGLVGYSLVQSVISGNVFGHDQPIVLHLLEVPAAMTLLSGITLEIEDCALPLVKEVVATDLPSVAFRGVDVAFLVGSSPFKAGMTRRDLLAANSRIFMEQGKALDRYAKKSVKVLVVANPANTNAAVCAHFAPSIPRENFSAMTRLDQNRATFQLAEKTNMSVNQIKNVVIWGNHSSGQFPDASHASIMGSPAPEVICDDQWLKEVFVPKVQKRCMAIAASGASSAMSAAKAASDHMRDWFLGTRGDDFVSMGVASDGSYGIPEGLIYSLPVRVKNGKVNIVKDLDMSSAFARKLLQANSKELVEEFDLAMELCEAAAAPPQNL